MEEDHSHPPCPENWGIRFLCDCRRQEKNISIHQGIASRISTHGVCLLSDHPVCQQKKIALQLLIPSLNQGAPLKIVKIIGNSILTIMKEGKFLTEIEFLHFEENGRRELEKHLRRRFHTRLFA
jgi:hypothetical protein